MGVNKEILKRVTDDLLALSPEQFEAELEKHKDVDIAQFFREIGEFEDYLEEKYGQSIKPTIKPTIIVKDTVFPELIWAPSVIWDAITQRNNCIQTAWVSISDKQNQIDHLKILLDEARRTDCGSRQVHSR
jgi:hypothetical protein